MSSILIYFFANKYCFSYVFFFIYCYYYWKNLIPQLLLLKRNKGSTIYIFFSKFFISNLRLPFHSWVQKFLVQATYWHDPLNEELYKNSSTFLSEINNEKEVKTAYVENLKSLTNFVMIKFGNDTMVEPVDSEWFGFYKTGQSVKTESLQDSAIYKEDRLGLREMDQMGKLKFLSVPGNHLQVDWDWFEENIVNVYLRHWLRLNINTRFSKIVLLI